MGRKQPQPKPDGIEKPPPPPPPPPIEQIAIMVTDNRGFTVIFEVDVDQALPCIKDRMERWIGEQQILKKSNYNYIKAYLTTCAAEIFYKRTCANKADLINLFSGLSNWTNLDGSQGITLVYVHIPPEDHQYFTYIEVPFKSGISILGGAQ